MIDYHEVVIGLAMISTERNRELRTTAQFATAGLALVCAAVIMMTAPAGASAAVDSDVTIAASSAQCDPDMHDPHVRTR